MHVLENNPSYSAQLNAIEESTADLLIIQTNFPRPFYGRGQFCIAYFSELGTSDLCQIWREICQFGASNTLFICQI